MAAFGANSVGQAGLTAIRTQGSLRYAQRIVRAPFVSTSFRMSSLRIWHNYSVYANQARWRRVYLRFLRAAQRGSISSVTHWHSPVFLSMPHSGQMPLQSSRQSMRVGTASKICSFTISSTSIAWPSKTETDISASVNSATPLDSYSDPVMYSNAKSALTGASTGCKQRSQSTCARASRCPLTKTSFPESLTFPLTLAGSVSLTRSSTGFSSSG